MAKRGGPAEGLSIKRVQQLGASNPDNLVGQAAFTETAELTLAPDETVANPLTIDLDSDQKFLMAKAKFMFSVDSVFPVEVWLTPEGGSPLQQETFYIDQSLIDSNPFPSLEFPAGSKVELKDLHNPTAETVDVTLVIVGVKYDV